MLYLVEVAQHKTGLFVIRQERRQGRRKGENDIKIESRAKKLSGMFDSNIWEIFRYFRILGGFRYHCTEEVYRTRVMRMINKSRSYLVKITGYPLVRSVYSTLFSVKPAPVAGHVW